MLTLRWLLGAGLCLYLVAGQSASIVRPFNWDEIDYVVAARRGIADNYLERGSLSLLQFIRLGRLKNSQDHAALVSLAASLPPESRNLPNLRHNHPPLLTYLLAPWTTGSADEERTVRWVYATLLLMLAAAVWGRWAGGFCALGLVALLTSDAATRTFATINFHVMLAIAVAMFFCAFPAALRGHRQGFLSKLPIAICAACVLLALETGFIVLGFVALGVTLYARPWTSQAEARTFTVDAFRYGALILAVFWLCWPGSLRAGEPVTTHLRLLYQVFFVANDDFSRVQPWKAWLLLVESNPLLFAFLGFAAVAVVVRFRDVRPATRIALLAGVGYSLAITPFLAEARYAFPGLLIVTLASGEALNSFKSTAMDKLGYALAAVVLALAFVRLDRPQLKETAQRERDNLNHVLAALRAVDRSRGPLLVDGAHIFRYYDPTMPIEKLDMLPSFRGGGLFMRRNYEYVNVDDEAGRHLFSAIVRQHGTVAGFGTRPPLPPATRAIVDREYPRQEVVDHYWIAQAR